MFHSMEMNQNFDLEEFLDPSKVLALDYIRVIHTPLAVCPSTLLCQTHITFNRSKTTHGEFGEKQMMIARTLLNISMCIALNQAECVNRDYKFCFGVHQT